MKWEQKEKLSRDGKDDDLTVMYHSGLLACILYFTCRIVDVGGC